jgi:hypothetical protein
MLGHSDQVADDTLREKARRRLEQVLEGDDPAAALRAATALYSYRAAPALEEQRAVDAHTEPLTADGRRPTSLADVVRFALSISEHGAASPDLVEACREVVDAGCPTEVSRESRSGS